MILRLPYIMLLCNIGLMIAAPAFAQPAEAVNQLGSGDKVPDKYAIAIGAGSLPIYEGSSQSRVSPVAAVRATIHGYDLTITGAAATLNLNPDRPHKTRYVYYGPSVSVGLSSNGTIRKKDPQIAALNIRRSSLNLGGQFGYQKDKVLHAYDSASFGVSMSDDVTGPKNSYTISPNATYGTPISKRVYIGLAASADYSGGGSARTFFGITPTQSLASGLPSTTIGTGWRDVTFSGLADVVLVGDLRHGLSLIGGVSHETLLGAFARSPIVRDKQQLTYGAGLAYQF